LKISRLPGLRIIDHRREGSSDTDWNGGDQSAVGDDAELEL